MEGNTNKKGWKAKTTPLKSRLAGATDAGRGGGEGGGSRTGGSGFWIFGKYFSRKSLLIASSLVFAYLTGVYSTYKYNSNKRNHSELITEQEEHCCSSPAHSIPIYNRIANQYDKKIEWDEKLLGIKRLRRKLLSHASGAVLEVSAGTGRNLPHYPKNSSSVSPGQGEITSLTLTDLSSAMLSVASNKPASLPSSRLQFLQMDSENLTFPDESFDTVIDTFGLCSSPHPQKILSEMKRVCKPNGKILLLEHGRVSGRRAEGFIGRRVNSYLDKNVENHSKKWGCWWNRDIFKLVSEEGGLTVQYQKRTIFGTTYYYVATPSTNTTSLSSSSQ